MACPYFHAVKPRTQTCGSRSAMLPLGDTWDGVCHAHPDAAWEPDEVTLRTLCNMGYARGCCGRFPADDGPDAARFTITRDSPETIGVYYVLERGHHPWAHGALEFSRAGALLDQPLMDQPLLGQPILGQPASESTLRLARAYVESYVRRISEASLP
jgi:hypothetical protein